MLTAGEAMVSKNSLNYLGVSAENKESVNMFFNIDWPQMFGELLDAEETKVVSFIGGYLRSLGVEVTDKNEVVIDVNTIKEHRKEWSDAIIYLHDHLDKL